MTGASGGMPDLQLLSQLQRPTAPWLVQNYPSWVWTTTK